MFKLSSRTREDQQRPAGPWNERLNKNSRDKGNSIGAVSPESTQVNWVKEVKVDGKEDVLALLACVPPFPKNRPDPSPTDLPARKKHNAVPPQSLNTDPLVQIIGTEMIDDAKACVLLDSGATTDLMSLAYAEAQSFDIKPITDLSDRFMNLKLAAGFRTTASGYVEYNLCVPGVSSCDSDRVALVTEDNTQFS